MPNALRSFWTLAAERPNQWLPISNPLPSDSRFRQVSGNVPVQARAGPGGKAANLAE